MHVRDKSGSGGRVNPNRLLRQAMKTGCCSPAAFADRVVFLGRLYNSRTIRRHMLYRICVHPLEPYLVTFLRPLRLLVKEAKASEAAVMCDTGTYAQVWRFFCLRMQLSESGEVDTSRPSFSCGGALRGRQRAKGVIVCLRYVRFQTCQPLQRLHFTPG